MPGRPTIWIAVGQGQVILVYGNLYIQLQKENAQDRLQVLDCAWFVRKYGEMIHEL